MTPGDVSITAARIGPKRQITLPREALEGLGLQPGDIVDVQVRDGALYLIPKAGTPHDQVWFWTRQWQEKEREADEAIVRGELSGPFEPAEELIEHLRRREDPDNSSI